MTALITTYNQPLDGIFATLRSVINQDCDDFEIVLTDDCSKNSPENDLRDFFAREDFSRYTLVMNQKNLGTVMNIVEGLKVAKGEYVKIIGAGDMLFAPNTLQTIYSFGKEQNIPFGFGKIMTFSEPSDGLNIAQFKAPTNPFDYTKTSNSKALAEQQISQFDWIPGGSFFSKPKFLIGYLQKLSLEFGVRYCEDFVSPLVALDEPIVFLDEYILWYEWGVGISNSGSSSSRQRMYADHSNFFNKLVESKVGGKQIATARRIFKIKRFVALHTPLHILIRKIGARHYLDTKTKEACREKEGIAFLKQCRKTN